MRKILLLLAFVALSSFAERPYAFRERLECVHERNMFDSGAKPAADEFAFSDGVVVSIPECGEAVLELAARDFEEYLSVSMGVSARVSVRGGGQVSVSLDKSLGPRKYRVRVSKGGVAVTAGSPRIAAQAFYHLEDLMNLRRAPFLKCGEETREHLFSPRMTHSAWGLDEFPEGHLRQIAHAGIDAIVVFIRDVDRTKGRPVYQDVNSLIRSAARWGIDTYLYSYVQAFAHPDDPGAREVFENSYGRVSAAYPGAKGFVFVGESCEFPSKDERVIPIRAADRGPEHKGDTRPMAGYFPCRDYPAWVRAVSAAIRAHNPNSDVVFWTYNWGCKPYGPRMELIDNLPKDVSLEVTWEMFESYKLPNGYPCYCNDYTLSFAGPGKYFSSEAVRAKVDGLRLYGMTNTGGRTWDYGAVPYLPVPFQWKLRWDGMVKAHDEWGLCGTMESHHNGWHPGFVAELAKEAFVRGGMPFDLHLRAIAARDFGAENVEAVVGAWRKWSEALTLQPPNHANQYSVFRVGPAYPFNALGPRIRAGLGEKNEEGYPVAGYTANGLGIVRMNYADDQVRQWREGLDYFPRLQVSEDAFRQETEALSKAAALYLEGADVVRRAAAGLDARRRDNALRMAGLGEFMGRTCTTAVNVKAAVREEDTVLSATAADAEKAAAKKRIYELARAEYENAQAALPLAEFDSGLGWEPSMEYVGGPEQIRWKLRRMEKLYGIAKGDAE